MVFKHPAIVDNTDWLKTAAILLVVIDHIGYFFIEDAQWWSVFGRLAAPPFFFLLGYAQTRTVPRNWVWLGVILTLLDSANAGWTWVAPNILLSFALIRLARPRAHIFLQKKRGRGLVVLVAVLIALLPLAAGIVDYGAEGWLWALFGLCQRMYGDEKLAVQVDGAASDQAAAPIAINRSAGLLRLPACLAAAVVYLWQEQIEFSFSGIQFAVFMAGVSLLSLSLYRFQRGASHFQPPAFPAGILRFFGRYTLEVYAIQLAGSELLVLLLPGLAG